MYTLAENSIMSKMSHTRIELAKRLFISQFIWEAIHNFAPLQLILFRYSVFGAGTARQRDL